MNSAAATTRATTSAAGLPDPGQRDRSVRPSARRPVIVVVDDDTTVLNAIAHDLREHFAEGFRVIPLSSGENALEAVRSLVRRGEQLAMFIADQRMPGMTGTDFLVQARRAAPTARRVLLTAYADVEAAIQAINEVSLDYYLVKPWDPPEERLFPVVEDLLSTWHVEAPPELTGARVIGHRFSRESHVLREFLARNRIPARWLDVERDDEAQQLLEAASVSPDALPVALLEDGSVLERPSLRELAQRFGIGGNPASDHYDLVVIGAGPAGLAAAVYGSSEGLRTVLIEREAPGGQAGQSSRIENYLGFPAGVSGSDLARRAADQARRLGAEIVTMRDAVALRPEGYGRVIELSDRGALTASSVIVACGVSYRRLDIPGFEEYLGRGIYYGAALSEARGLGGQTIALIGGANSAGQAAVYFATFGARVTLLVRSSSLRKSMSHYLIAQIEALDNIEVCTDTEVVGAEGDERLRALQLRHGDQERGRRLFDACFVFIGAEPRTDWLAGVLARDEAGFILAGPDVKGRGWPLRRDPYPLETSVPGVLVAGDVRARSIKRVASAVGEGSMAVALVHDYLIQS
jgi:thioredoxin reductase (NADPH)